MHIVAVDLAAKYSAVCLMGDGFNVITQWDSWGRTEAEFIEMTTAPFSGEHYPPPDLLAVEDLPHRLPFASLVKHVCRIQGRLVERMERYGCVDRVLFVPPSEWRKTYEGMGRGTGPDVVTPVAERFGYTPPPPDIRCLAKGGKAIGRKVATDYCAAYLIGRWAMTNWAEHATFDAPGTSRYAKQATPKAKK